MPFPTQFTLVASNTNATTQGAPVNFGAIANQWSVQIVSSGQIGEPTINVWASCDGTNYSRVDQTAITVVGNWLKIATPAQYAYVNIGGNNGTVVVYAVAQSD